MQCRGITFGAARFFLLRRGSSSSRLLDSRALPRIDGMAAVALRAVLTEMPVILVVTAPALRRRLHRARRFVMAIGALQLLVGAQERKVSFLGVIEGPNLPSVRRVAALALLAEAALVHVIVRMALVARRRRPVERERRVALRAADDPMQPR